MTTKAKKPAAKPSKTAKVAPKPEDASLTAEFFSLPVNKSKTAKPAKQAVVNNTPATEPTAASTAAESKPAKAAKAPIAPKDQRNGITRPGAGTACRAIWDLLDTLKADGKELTFATLRAGIDPKIADATVRTQRQRWNHYSA